MSDEIPPRKAKASRQSPKQAPQRPQVPSNLLLEAFAIFALALFAYWNSLHGTFHFDDQGMLLDPYVVNPGFGWKILRLMQTRPLTFLTFHWNYLFDARPEGFHLVNIALHGANSVLVLLLARRRLGMAPSFAAAAIFAVHPLNTQAVNYIFERATLLAAFFALLSLLLFLRKRYPWSLVAFGLSLLAKEELISLPVFVLCYEVWCRRERIRWSYFAGLLSLALLAATRLWYALHISPNVKLGFDRGISSASYALTQCRVICDYLKLSIFPSGLTIDHDVAASSGPFSPPATFFAFGFILFAICALAWQTWRGRESALWAVGFFILLAPTSSIVPTGDLMFEHRTYFPLALLLIALVLEASQFHFPYRTYAVGLLLAVLLCGTIFRNRVWHDERTLWNDVIAKAPARARGYFQLGQVYAREDPGQAGKLYERGLQLEPNDPVGHTNLGVLLLSEGSPPEALFHFRMALASGGDQTLLWNNIGTAQIHLGRLEEATSSLRQALALNPCRFDARMNLIRVLAGEGQMQAALLASQVPTACEFLVEQTQQLEDERHLVESAITERPFLAPDSLPPASARH